VSSGSSGSDLAAGLAALGQGRWADAAAALEAAVDGDERPAAEALAALGDATWWLGPRSRPACTSAARRPSTT
jgi:uncharacterized protein HemY